MAATGTCKKALLMGGEGYPAQNSRNNRQKPAHWMRETMKFRLTGYTAVEVAADVYTYTLYTVGAAGARSIGKIIEAAYLVSPEELAVDATNYNTIAIEVGGDGAFSRATNYGIKAYEPWEIITDSLLAVRTLVADDAITLVVTATLTASAIADGTEVWLILRNA